MRSLSPHCISARSEASGRVSDSAGQVPGGVQKEGYFVESPKAWL